MKYLARVAVYGQTHYPVVVGRLIHRLSAKKHSTSTIPASFGLAAANAAAGVPAEQMAPFNRTSGRRAADIAAGVPGAI